MGMTEKQGGTDCARQYHDRDPAADGLSHHRAQMVHVGADVRRLPGAGAGAGRADLLPDAALPARRLGQRLRFQRLKDKLGNRSNASSEVEFVEAFAWRVGEEGAACAPSSRWCSSPASIA
jgi:putative acyl-CoA dehydrogenase